MKKITVLGDVMSEPLFLEEARREDGGYDYYPAFAPLKALLDEADYRIANLETPLAGEEALYSQTIFDFNAPDALADALRPIHAVVSCGACCMRWFIQAVIAS